MSDPTAPQPRRKNTIVRQSDSPNASDGQSCPCYEEVPWASAEALEVFLSRHVIPYEPDTDDYERPPFAVDSKEGRYDPVHSAHSYHTKVPPRAIVPYILHYTEPGDVVLDLFSGSGMTGVAAQMCADPPGDILQQFPEFRGRIGLRTCVLNDLAPAACHITYNYNTPVDIDAFRCEFERIKAAVKDEFDWLYATEHYEPAVGRYNPRSPAVACHLKTPTGGKDAHTLLGEEHDRTWEVLNSMEVEARLGYPVTELPYDEKGIGLDISEIKEWICIPATLKYTVWSDVYRCEGLVTVLEPTGKLSTRGKNAGKPMVKKRRVARGCSRLFDLWSTALDRSTGAVAELFRCPYCQAEWKKTQLRKQPQIPVWSCVEFVGLSRQETLTHQVGARQVTRLELQRISECESQTIPYWVPDVGWDKNWPQYRRNALAGRGIQTLADFYTRRNLRALASIMDRACRCGDARIAAALMFNFTSIFRFVDRRAIYSPNGLAAMTGTLYFPSLSVEHNIWKLFESKLSRTLVALEHINAASEIVVTCGSATKLNSIPADSIDYIFTDPPFGSNIYYSEMNLLWEGWLGQLTDQSFEAVVHRKNDGGSKRLEDYGRLMTAAFHEMFRVLKPGRWATVEFNNSDGAVFEAIKQGIREAGFEIANMLLFDKVKKTFKQIKGAEGVEDVVDKDVLFNLHKPAAVRADVSAEEHDLEHQIADAVRVHLQTLPNRITADPAKYNDEHRSTATINSMLMNTLIPRGVSVERLNLPFIERVCARYFRKVGQHWYLRGQAVGNGTSQDGLFEEEIQVKDEVTAIEWLRQKLHAAPLLLGELKPLWMRTTGLLCATVSQVLSLEDLLAENFWRDQDSNRWREPTEEERERMNDDRSIRVLHDAERFVAGSLRRQTTDSERCDWIDVLFKACREVEDGDEHSTPALRGFDCGEGYRLVARLFQTILKENVPPADFSRVEKQTAAASKRITQEVREEKRRRRSDAGKKRGPTLFDMDEVT